MYLLLSTRESEAQERYISDLSQIRLEEIKKVRLSTKEAHKIIEKLLDKKTKEETINQLHEMIEKADKDKKIREQREPTDPNSPFTIDDGSSYEDKSNSEDESDDRDNQK